MAHRLWVLLGSAQSHPNHGDLVKHLLIAIAVLSLAGFATTGCASEAEAKPAAVVAPTAKAAPVYPANCNKLRQCLDAYKAQHPDAGPEYESLWNKVTSANNQGSKQASDFCAMSLRGYSAKATAPMSCK